VDVLSRQGWIRIVARVVCEDLNFDQIVRVCKSTGRSCVFNKDSFYEYAGFCIQEMLYCHANSVHGYVSPLNSDYIQTAAVSCHRF